MKKILLTVASVMVIFLLLLSFPGSDERYLSSLMPTEEERTSLWWREGFPGLIEGAPWQQCLVTGTYGLVFDTENISLPHFGAIPEGMPEGQTPSMLPAADLELVLKLDGKTYRHALGGEWSKFTGPRLVNSGRFFQRFDVTHLTFEAEDGTSLNTEARIEVAAWHDRLTLTLAARPGHAPLETGLKAFGKAGGGFGLDGTNRFDLPRESVSDLSSFTLSFHTYVPPDFKATATSPWLLCKGAHELADGHLGIALDHQGVPRATLNPGGGRENLVSLRPQHRRPLDLDQWNHLVLSYDGHHYRFFLNGQLIAEERFEVHRPLSPTAFTFGRRQDNFGDGYAFRGIVDEIQLFSAIVTPDQITGGSAGEPVGAWTFDPSGTALSTKPRDQWSNGLATLTIRQHGRELSGEAPIVAGDAGTTVSLAIDPVTFTRPGTDSTVSVEAITLDSGEVREVVHDETVGWHRINLDGVIPIPPEGTEVPSHDSLERVLLTLSNPAGTEKIARLLFEKTRRGIQQRIGTPITGISAILRDREGNPTGLPVQLSKNWHDHPAAGAYSGQWFHGISQLRLPPQSETELELTICYGHWGGVAAASHAQLCLIGWGSNQRWDQSALGSWGESICYEPDQIQGKASVTDVRPLMVRSMSEKPGWGWTENVGGGDFFRVFDPAGRRLPHAAMRAEYHRHGPCLTEVTYTGKIAEGLYHSITTSLARTDDLVRATYRIRLKVDTVLPFSRLVIFQVGADSYNKSHEKKFAIGNEKGLLKEWETTPGGSRYHTEPRPLTGDLPWVSMHEGTPAKGTPPAGAWANRGIVIRSWDARLGGIPASPWLAEHGSETPGTRSSTADLVPPPGVTSLKPGDFVEAVIEHLILPCSANDYLGPNEELRDALTRDANTWRLVEREAVGNERRVRVTHGSLDRRYPDITIQTRRNRARFTLDGGMGYVPVTFGGLSRPDTGTLWVNGRVLDQATHGSDFWQTDYDPLTETWSRTYNIPINEKAPIELRFR